MESLWDNLLKIEVPCEESDVFDDKANKIGVVIDLAREFEAAKSIILEEYKNHESMNDHAKEKKAQMTTIQGIIEQIFSKNNKSTIFKSVLRED